MTDTQARTEALRILFELMTMGDDLFIHLNDDEQEAVHVEFEALVEEIHHRLTEASTRALGELLGR